MSAGTEPDQAERAVDDLWRFYDEHAAQARQHENLRASATSTLGGFAAALVGFAGIDGLDRSDIPAGALVIVFGILGAVLSLKHYERNRLHVRVMGAVRDEITKIHADAAHAPRSTQQLREGAEAVHNARITLRPKRPKERPKSWLVRASLSRYWAALPVAVALAGVAIVVLAL